MPAEGKPLIDQLRSVVDDDFERQSIVAESLLRFLTGPEAPEALAHKIMAHLAPNYANSGGGPHGGDYELANAILNLLAEKCLKI